MTTLFLIRHATCDGLGETLWGRTPGVCLNPQGRLQAAQLASRLRGVPLSAIYSSPLERALETAEALAQEVNLGVVQNDGLNEIHYGDWSGMTVQSLIHDRLWRRFNDCRSDSRIPGGDLMPEVQTRIVGELCKLSSIHNDQAIAIVSHADPIKAALARFVGIHLDLMNRIEISPCSVSSVAINGGVPRVLTVNCVADFQELHQ